MQASSNKLTLLAIIVCHLAIHCDAMAFSARTCGYDTFSHLWRCERRLIPKRRSCSQEGSLCRPYGDLSDCLLPKFRCVGNFRCIPRRYLCNGIPDCIDGSDEWGCIPDTTSAVSTTNSRMSSETVQNTSSYITTISTMLRDNEEKTTSVIPPESEENTSSTPSTTRMILPNTEKNTVLSSSQSTTTNTMFPDSKSNTNPSSSTTGTNTMFPDFVSNTTPSSSTTRTMIPKFESNTAPPTSTATNTMFSHSKWNTTLPSSSTTKTMILESESNTTSSIPATTKMILPTSEANTPFSTFVANNTILSLSPEKTSSPTIHIALPVSSAMQSCPDNYCMQNAECIVVQGQYRCKCPSSFIGELCEIQLGTEQASLEYAVVIAISMTLSILCLAVGLVCIYRYKRLSSWKLSDRTSRTLSQLTLASNAVE